MVLSYDLSAIKRIDSYKSDEVRVRTVVLAVVAGFAAWIQSDVNLILWFVVYQSIFSLYAYVLIKVPKRVRFWSFCWILGLGAFSMLALISPCAYLYSKDTFAQQLGGLVLYFGAAMNIVAVRVREPSYFVVDLMSFAVIALGFVVIEYHRTGFDTETYAVALAMASFCTYFAYLVFEMDLFRKKLETAREGQLAAEHQRAIGQISGGVAHDFNNLLTVVLGNLELSRQIQDPVERNQMLVEAETAARRGATLTGQLLAFSRKANLSPRVVRVDQVVAELKPLTQGMLRRGHRLQVSETEDLPPLFIDAATLLAVLLNLILNARDAMPDGGTIWLDAEVAKFEDRDHMCLKINDTGSGIAPSIMDKIFEPFFSTKPAGQGSGLGLPMAQGFSEQSGGGISVKSTPGEGTEVRLFLPLADEETLVDALETV
ncbi:MAG: ATP-binding protein [Aliishimia sp.]